MGALRRQLAELLDAAEGTRNDTLNKSAFAIGQFVGAGMLDEESTAAVLEDAGQRIGLAPGEVRRSVASGLRAGARYPRAAGHDRQAGRDEARGGRRRPSASMHSCKADTSRTRPPGGRT